MRRIKAFLYNNQIDLVISIFGSIILILLSLIRHQIIIDILFCVLMIYGVATIILNFIKSKNLKYLQYGCPLLYKKAVWINQRINPKGNSRKCPQKEFVKELNIIFKEIPDGTTCYCCTHELIKKHILKKFPSAEVSKAYTKNLKRIKKKIMVRQCKRCQAKKCSVLKNSNTQFYAVKFVVNKNADCQ